MKKKNLRKSFAALLTGAIIFILAGSTAVFAQSPPALDGQLDAVYKSHGRSFSYQGFYLNANAILYIIDDTGIDATYVYIAWVIDRAFNDNSYGTYKHSSWGGTGHTFHDLAESDKQRLDLENDCGEIVLDYTMDLLHGPYDPDTGDPVYGAYGTPSGFEADSDPATNLSEDTLQSYINAPDWTATYISYDTSTASNLNDFGYCVAGDCSVGVLDLLGTPSMFDDGTSPSWDDEANYIPDQTNYPDWEYSIIWEMKINRSVFAKQCIGCACDGVYQGVATNPVELHASPSKSVSPVTTFPAPGKIGDYVWHDVNRDGVQDFNEPGFANVTLALYTDPDGDGSYADGSLIETTNTDLNGYYAFLNLGEGNYIVEVTDTNGVLAGFSTTTGTTNPHSAIALEQGGAYLDADFGYALTDDTLAVIGDFVWSDADDDGMQDPGEPGIGGVTVRLWEDTDGDGYDDLVADTTTGDDGYYLFTNVAPGDYKVEVTDTGSLLTGYTLTDGPQSSTDPTHVITVAAGDAYLNADFGYYKATGLYSLGNQVWLEIDKSGRPPLAGEPADAGHGEYEAAKTTDTGIANVTLNLFKDSDGDGVRDADESIIATTTTAADGTYSFDGLEPGDYLVEVSDLDNVLKDFRKSLYYYNEPDPIFGAGGDPTTDTGVDNYSKRESYAVTITTADNTTADFGYWVDVDNGSPGIVGDYVWFDLDGDTVQDPDEPGIEGVLVELWSVTKKGADSKQLGEAYTDGSGKYLFSNLDVSAQGVTYRVKVAAGNFAAGGPLENYFLTTQGAPVPAAPHVEDSVALTDTNSTDLTLDFGYSLNDPGGGTLTYTIGDYVWLDVNEDGIQGDPLLEGGIQDVTLALYRDNGTIGVIDAADTIIATTTTDNTLGTKKNYEFTGLTDGNYIVQITDENNVLTGYYKTFGIIPWPVTISGADNLNIDFGFNAPEPPTHAFITPFHAYSDGGRVVVHWETAAEIGTAGFYLLRLDEATGKYKRVNKEFLPGLMNSPKGGIYRCVDSSAVLGGTYLYKLVEIESGPGKRIYGPFKVTVGVEQPGVDRIELEPLRGLYGKQPHPVSPEREVRMRSVRQSLSTAKLSAPAVRKGSDVKVVVREKGLYFLDAAAIAAGTGRSHQKVVNMIKNRRLRLLNRGLDIAYLPGKNGSGLYFYGQDIDSIYTLDNVYWLTAGTGTGMEFVDGGMPAPTGGTEIFKDFLHLEKDNYSLTALFHDPEADYWLWDFVSAGQGGKSFKFNANAPSSYGDARLTVHLKGATDIAAVLDHHAEVSLNGNLIGSGSWNGKEAHNFDLYFDQSLLIDGENTIEVKGILDNGVSQSIFHVDSFDLKFRRFYRAVNDMLLCYGAKNAVITVDGFTHPDIYVFDITAPARPRMVTGVSKDGAYRVSFVPRSGSRYLVLSPNGTLTPHALITDKLSNLKAMRSAADYVVITPAGLENAAKKMANFQQNKGLEAKVIELEDIYDEFNHGIANPAAIKDFLAYAYNNWDAGGLKYALFAGEGSYDYKNNLGHGDCLIPPLLVDTPRGLFAADGLFGDIEGADGAPEIAIGRLPVMTPAELRAYVDKLADYESSTGAWTGKVLMLADNADDGGNFPYDSAYLSSLLTGYSIGNITLPDSARSDQVKAAKQQAIDGINSGVLLVNYVGHAGLNLLANEGLLRTSDLSGLFNGDRLPIFSALTCVVGRFALPGYDTLGESLVLKDNGGAVAVWAPSGASYNTPAIRLGEAFFRAAFSGREKVLGKAILQAKRDCAALGIAPFMLNIYNLLGDPALEIK
ncbi:MAG: hypothetical protein KAW12_03915 [Candidatus Aminicenantes bacterium]|nr:hypothetical protein [Candidatus Aminicenantes bacterium]